MDYRILFIDEEDSQHDDFLDYFESIYPEITPNCLFPCKTMEEMIQVIDDYKPDAIITDYRLNEIKTNIKYNVPYNGVQLIKTIREQWDNFPCFVVTSFDDDAVNDSDDVNLVYIKDILHQSKDKAKVPFASRITNQIEKYIKRKVDAGRELSTLIAKREAGNANCQDENRIIQLDTFLERTLGAHNSVPEELKQLTNLDRLNSLIDKVDELIKRLD